MSLKSSLRSFLKFIAYWSPVALSKGQRIDRQTQQIMKRHLREDSNCIDIGAHKGEILEMMMNFAPKGSHFAFEPLPHLFTELEKNYGRRAVIKNCALSDIKGRTEFHYVESNPAYSGIKKRTYEKEEVITKLDVELRVLDECIPVDININLIKIDVEGAELLVLKGAQRILQAFHPLLIFEHGKGGADHYAHGPQDIWTYLVDTCNYEIYTLGDFLAHNPPVSLAQLNKHFDDNGEFYFVGRKKH